MVAVFGFLMTIGIALCVIGTAMLLIGTDTVERRRNRAKPVPEPRPTVCGHQGFNWVIVENTLTREPLAVMCSGCGEVVRYL